MTKDFRPGFVTITNVSRRDLQTARVPVHAIHLVAAFPDVLSKLTVDATTGESTLVMAGLPCQMVNLLGFLVSFPGLQCQTLEALPSETLRYMIDCCRSADGEGPLFALVCEAAMPRIVQFVTRDIACNAKRDLIERMQRMDELAGRGDAVRAYGWPAGASGVSSADAWVAENVADDRLAALGERGAADHRSGLARLLVNAIVSGDDAWSAVWFRKGRRELTPLP